MTELLCFIQFGKDAIEPDEDGNGGELAMTDSDIPECSHCHTKDHTVDK